MPAPHVQHHGRRAVGALLFLAVILLAVTLAPVALQRRSFRLGERMLFATQPLHETAERVSRETYELQASERGYLLTHDPQFFRSYRTASSELEATLDDAARTATPEETRLLARVRSAARAWLSQVAGPRMELAESGHRDQALAAEAHGDGEDRFGALQAADAALSAYAEDRFADQALHRRRLARLVDASAIGLGIAGLVGLAVLAYALLAAVRLQGEASQAHAQNKLKDEFLSLVGHEIRTPVTVIRLVSDAIRRHEREDHLDSAWLRDRLATLQRQAQRIGWLIDELVDVGSAPGGLELRRARTDAVALTERAVASVQASAPSYPLELRCDADRADADLDELRIEQVLVHLVGNAVKFSLRPKPVKVRLRVDDDALEWTITDRGSGIPRDEQPRLFQRFYRGSNAPQSGGIGLGLHLSRVIVMAHGGRVWFDSAPGRGSVFHVRLPRYLRASELSRARPTVTVPEPTSPMTH